MNTGQKQIEAAFVVLKGHSSILLGGGTSEALQLLGSGHRKEEHQNTYDDLRRKYATCFTGLGKLKDFKIGTAS